MADFHEKGFALVELFDPQIALDAWDEIDQRELHHIAGAKSDKPWNVMIPPLTPKFRAFAREIEKNMPLCRERYGKKWMKPKMVEQHLDVFNFSRAGVVRQSLHEHIWLWVPIIPVSQNQGLPTFLEGSHRHTGEKVDKPYNPILRPGSGLLFDARIRTRMPDAGGGLVFARAYDVAKPQVP